MIGQITIQFTARTAIWQNLKTKIFGTTDKKYKNQRGNKMTKTIGGYDFKYIDTINPEKDENGKLKTVKYNLSENEIHRFGGLEYCYFNVEGAQGKSGVYALFVDDELVYIGSTYNLAVRWSREQYGKIIAGECKRKNGLITNCNVNANICKAVKENKECKLYFYGTSDYKKIESEIIKSQQPVLNIRLKHK